MYPNSTCVSTCVHTTPSCQITSSPGRDTKLRDLPGQELHAFVQMTVRGHTIQTERELNKTETPSACSSSGRRQTIATNQGSLTDPFGKSSKTQRKIVCSEKPRTAAQAQRTHRPVGLSSSSAIPVPVPASMHPEGADQGKPGHGISEPIRVPEELSPASTRDQSMPRTLPDAIPATGSLSRSVAIPLGETV